MYWFTYHAWEGYVVETVMSKKGQGYFKTTTNVRLVCLFYVDIQCFGLFSATDQPILYKEACCYFIKLIERIAAAV